MKIWALDCLTRDICRCHSRMILSQKDRRKIEKLHVCYFSHLFIFRPYSLRKKQIYVQKSVLPTVSGAFHNFFLFTFIEY